MTQHQTIVAIDPGITGAIAIFVDGRVLDVHDMPVTEKRVNGRALADLLEPCIPYTMLLEDVHAMPKNGSIGSFSLGRSKGVLEGLVAAMRMPCEYVSPAKWKRDLGLSKDKGASRRRAADAYPEIAARFDRVKDDGRAEAVLLAHWYINVRK